MFKSLKSKLAGLGVALMGAVNANAAVIFDSSTKTFSGEFDLSPYYSALTVIVGAIAIVAAISLAIKQLRRVH